jgi:arsenate reductase-like glutaredoxin family protein
MPDVEATVAKISANLARAKALREWAARMNEEADNLQSENADLWISLDTDEAPVAQEVEAGA